jgi:hypothetical protein
MAAPTITDVETWRFRLMNAERLLDGQLSGERDEPVLSPAYRALAAGAVERLAIRLVVPLFVGRPDPALARPPTDRIGVIGP